MGSYAGYDSTHYPFEPDELDEFCNVCRNTGVVMYPLSVGVHREEADACPNGCEIGEMVIDEYGEAHYLPVYPAREAYEIPEDDKDTLIQWYTHGDLHQDPFYILSNHMRVRNIRPYTAPVPSKHAGSVSSDHPIMGLVEDGRRVYPCTVPAYLVGAPVEVTDEYTVVRYTYLGAKLDVRFGKTEASFLRFSYSWDNNFSTDQLLGK